MKERLSDITYLPYRALSWALTHIPYWGRILPDEIYLKIKFRSRLRKKLDLDNPTTFNEKLQWLKLYDRRPKYTMMVDKYAVKQYVADIIGEEHIIPTLGVWGRFDEIDFGKLPDQFVIKCTHDCGSTIICRDKRSFDIQAAKKKLEKCLKRNYYWGGREWPYKDVEPRIIAEKYLEESTDNLKTSIKSITDYKYYCFGGTPEFVYISKGKENHDTAIGSFYDLDGKELDFTKAGYLPFHNTVTPDNLHEMSALAGEVAKKIGNSFSRIDLYSVDNNIYFSEITLTPSSGIYPFTPESADLWIGDLLIIK